MQDTEARSHFGISFCDITKVAAETVFIQFLIGFTVPKAATIWANFIGQKDLMRTVLEAQSAKFDFKVDKLNSNTVIESYRVEIED